MGETGGKMSPQWIKSGQGGRLGQKNFQTDMGDQHYNEIKQRCVSQTQFRLQGGVAQTGCHESVPPTTNVYFTCDFSVFSYFKIATNPAFVLY